LAPSIELPSDVLPDVSLEESVSVRNAAATTIEFAAVSAVCFVGALANCASAMTDFFSAA
jgi:hypothetical protein